MTVAAAGAAVAPALVDSTATPPATSSAVPATGSPGSVLNLQSAGSTAVTSLTGEPVASVGVSSADSDLMKEFEKAVEQQKSTEAPPAASQSAENSQLMNQFENFVKKS